MRMTECLHCQINELIRARLEHDHPIDLNDLVAKIVECAAELIADIAPAEEQAKAVAEAIRHLGHSYLEKSGCFGERPPATH
jgi:hypothetical protein